MGEAGKHRVSQNVAVRNTFRTLLFAAAAYPNQQVADLVSPPSYRRDLLVVARHTAILFEVHGQATRHHEKQQREHDFW